MTKIEKEQFGSDGNSTMVAQIVEVDRIILEPEDRSFKSAICNELRKKGFICIDEGDRILVTAAK